MKIHIEVSDEKAEFLMQLLQEFAFVQILADQTEENDLLKLKIEQLEADLALTKPEEFSEKEEKAYLDAVRQSEEDISAGLLISHEDLSAKIEKL